MKYKALILSLLLVLPMLAAVSTVHANWPTPPPVQTPTYYNPILWVNMNNTGEQYTPALPEGSNYTSIMKVYGPCVVSTDFPVDVNLWNDISMTNTDVYAFDFTLTWTANTTSFISCVGIKYNLPAGWVLVTETPFSEGMTTFEFAATDVAPNTGITLAANTTLVELTMHIDDEPVWLNGPTGMPPAGTVPFTATFELNNIGMSGDGKVPIALTPELDNGEYYLYSTQPDVCLASPDQRGPANFTAGQGISSPETNVYYIYDTYIGETHKIEVLLSDITHAYGFGITVTFDPNYKASDIQMVTIGPDWILANYAYENITVTGNSVTVTVIRPLPPDKPLICSTLDIAFTFVLTAESPQVTAKDIPFGWNSTIAITGAWLLEYIDYPPSLGTVAYTYGVPPAIPITPNWVIPASIAYTCDMVNVFNPKTTDLLEDDGITDIKDLDAIIAVYDMATGGAGTWSHLADPYVGAPYHTGLVVDIFDVVLVAKHMGDP